MEWISVTDRLPKMKDRGPRKNPSSDHVLVWDGTRMNVGVRFKINDIEHFLPNTEEWWDPITHWMPLLEPPQS